MNTPAHAILNLLLLGRARPAGAFAAIALGAVLPDLPMMFFYAVEKLALGMPEGVIWGRAYFESGWQAFFDVFNSFPLIAVGAAFAWGRRRWNLLLLFASMGLHACADLPLHHDDSHRHFFPLSEWRFASPVSYWDPAHFGRVALSVELALMCVGSVWLWRRNKATSSRAIVCALAGVYALFVGYAMSVWL